MAIRHNEQMIVNGRLTQVGVSFKINKSADKAAVFLCSCGTRKVQIRCKVRQGKIVSCGCIVGEKTGKRNTTHGGRKSKEYDAWASMRKRCSNKNNKRFGDYGGRGITICDRWSKFENFRDDMGCRPDNTSIDRIDVNGNYCPENCRWATMKEQMRNTRRSIVVEIDGVSKTVSEWCEHPDSQAPRTIYNRVRAGVAGREAVFGAPKR